MSKKLTKTVVETLEVKPKDYTAWCADLPGFACRVWPSGKKVFVAQYRLGGEGRRGKLRKVTIGTFGTLTVDQARAKAKEVLSKATLGEDVAAERQAKRAELTVAELCDEYLEACDKGLVHDSKGKPKKESTIYTDRGRIERHIKPLLGKVKLGEVDRKRIEGFMFEVANGKTAGVFKNDKGNRVAVTGGEGTAKRTVRLLGGIFTFAVRQGYLKTNPRFGMKIAGDRENERFMSAEEFARLGEVLHEAETVGLAWQTDGAKQSKHLPTNPENRRTPVDPFAVAAIRLLMLTGCRLREILHLRWRDVDLQRGLLNLPDSKTGKKNVILGQAAIDVLEGLRALRHNGECVIAGADPDKPRSDLKRPWERITRAAGLDGLRLHDLRHSFASAAAGAGLDLLVIGKMLGHKDPKTTARYAHLVDSAKARAADVTNAAIAAAMNGRVAR